MIKPIETVHNGYKFKSRLEARWAVFWDTLGVEYEYEKEGFDINGIWYLPDFFVSNYTWVEIKPLPMPTGKEFFKILNKCCSLAYQLKQLTILICGQPWPSKYHIYVFAHDFPFPAIKGSNFQFGPLGTLTTENYIDNELLEAFKAARQARFEHR